MFKGEYPPALLEACGPLMPKIEDGDMKTISQKIDWWGLNYYTPMRVAADPNPDAPYPAHIQAPPVHPEKTDIGWEIDSSGLSHVVRDLYARYDLPNATSTKRRLLQYGLGADGEVDDQPRLDYYADHLSVTADLIRKAIPSAAISPGR